MKCCSAIGCVQRRVLTQESKRVVSPVSVGTHQKNPDYFTPAVQNHVRMANDGK